MNLFEDMELLKTMRDNNDRKSMEVIEIWENSISENLQKLGPERYAILEQVCIAAIDTRQLRVADKCIRELYIDFPKSLRVKKFQAMVLEGEGKYDDAMDILEEIIKEDPTNSAAKKRKICILQQQGKTAEAIRDLIDYLKVCMADVEAWQVLSELYISEQDFGKAGFCVEELILHNPHNHLLHQRYADIKYTQGGLENLEIAKAYYCQAIKLNPRNLRALYGLQMTATAILQSQKCSAQKKKDAMKLQEWVIGKITKLYNATHVDNVESRLAALQIHQ